MRKNLNPQVWGKNGWTFLKQCAEACDEESFPAYLDMISLLPEVLPCEKCRAHARTYIRDHPPKPGEDLVEWIQAFERSVGERKRQEATSVAPRPPRRSVDVLLVTSLVLLALCFVFACLSFLMCFLRKRLEMDTVKAFATADPSFAGIGAYYSNVPMKVFMGNEPPLPVEVAAKALDSMQKGHASPGNVHDAKLVLQPSSCQTTCLQHSMETCKAGPKESYASCAQAAKNACSAQCASVGRSAGPPMTKPTGPPMMKPAAPPMKKPM